MSARGRWIALFVAGCVTLFSGGRARAYVRSLSSDGGAPLFWVTPQATLEVTRPPDYFPIDADGVHAAVEAAAQTWSYPTLACTTVA